MDLPNEILDDFDLSGWPFIDLRLKYFRRDDSPPDYYTKRYCKWGHEFTLANTVVRGRNRRCKKCCMRRGV